MALVLAVHGTAQTIRPTRTSEQKTNEDGPSDRQFETKIDRYVEAEMKRYKIPGVSLAILRDGKISLLKSYGMANVELGVPVKPETIFQSGSIGKQFTAAAVMLLVQEGKLALDDKITKYLPNTPDSWKNITIRHLLTQTSGMGDYPDEVSLRRDYTEDEYLEIFKKAPLNFAPGTKWDYSNVGYVTLGILIRKVTGKFYGDYLQERIFIPLGMSTARVISESDIIPNRAAGYRLVNGELKNQEWVSPSTNSTADGALYLSILDLAKWDEALTADWSQYVRPQGEATDVHPYKLFARPSLEQIWTPVKLSDGRVKGYGFGWFTDTIRNQRLVFHGGAWQGFKSYIIRFLDEKLTIIFLANSWSTNDFKIARGLMAIFHPEFALDELSTRQPPRVEEGPEIHALFTRVLMQLANEKIHKELFTPEFQMQLFPAKAQMIGELLRSLTLPVAVVNLGELVERRDRMFKYVLTDISGTLVCTLTLTEDNKIAGLTVEKGSR